MVYSAIQRRQIISHLLTPPPLTTTNSDGASVSLHDARNEKTISFLRRRENYPFLRQKTSRLRPDLHVKCRRHNLVMRNFLFTFGVFPLAQLLSSKPAITSNFSQPPHHVLQYFNHTFQFFFGGILSQTESYSAKSMSRLDRLQYMTNLNLLRGTGTSRGNINLFLA